MHIISTLRFLRSVFARQRRASILVLMCCMPLTIIAENLEQLDWFEDRAVTPAEIRSIREFILQVWQDNSTIQSAQARVLADEANLTAAAKPTYNPALDLLGEYVAQDRDESFYALGITQTVDRRRGKRNARQLLGEEILLASKAELVQLHLEVANKALVLLAEYQTNTEAARLLAQQVRIMQAVVKQAKGRYQAGDINQTDHDFARLALATTISGQLGAELALSYTLEKLQAIVGSDSAIWPSLNVPTTVLVPLNAEEIPALLLSLPKIQVLNYRVAMARAQIKLARAEARPDPTVFVNGGIQGHELLVGGAISMPLFIRNNFQAEIEQANHLAIAAEKTRMDVYDQAKARLTGANKRYRLLYQAWADWQAITRQPLQQGMQILVNLWVAAELSTQDYLEQLRQRLDRKLEGTTLRGEVVQAWFNWLDAAGTLQEWLQEEEVK